LGRDNSGNYHLVFASGGEIFYRRYNQTVWESPIRLSNGNGENNYPSITLGFNGSDKVYVTWQRKTGTTNYDLYFAVSSDGGSTFSSANKYIIASVTSASNPVPVITSNLFNGRNTIAYTTSSGIKAKHTASSVPIYLNWSSEQVLTTLNDPNPTVASCGTSSYNILAYQNSSNAHVYYRYQNNDGSWSSTPVNLTSMVPGQSQNQNPTICGMPSDGSVHVACVRYTYVNGYPTNPRTFYTKNSNAAGQWPY
jgi:hypothetical protein